MIPGVINREGLFEAEPGVSLHTADEVLTCSSAIDFLISTLSAGLQPKMEETFKPLREARVGIVRVLQELEENEELRALLEEGEDVDDAESFFFVGLPESATDLVKIALTKYAENEGVNELSSQRALELIGEINANLSQSGQITPESLN